VKVPPESEMLLFGGAVFYCRIAFEIFLLFLEGD